LKLSLSITQGVHLATLPAGVDAEPNQLLRVGVDADPNQVVLANSHHATIDYNVGFRVVST